ncbi:DUF2523 domain-containing protein [Acinetobacter bereziniae]|uniref:DUF2523 domain-containing protein n=1 Tax=Acinetobacter bereziniae TaxID=106648 RepID=UPI0021D0C7E4|nr:DUF2523 domain-containing protein [Acinetobacter bereziniae]MCU4601516.1 DUF2523 domain-containing protein [Acinetobacter bereziniae]
MPAVLIAIFASIASRLIARLLVGAGLTIITFNVINDLIGRLENLMRGYLYSLPSDFLYIVQILNFDFYLSVLMSAYTIAGSIKSAKVFFGKA